MISLSDISYRYPGNNQSWDLEGITLTIEDGEFVLICGGSGSGKSTLAYLLNGLIPHFFNGILQGAVCIDGMDTREMSVARLLPHVGMVLQNTDAHLFSSTVENEIAFGLESLGMEQAEITARIRRIAEMLRIEDLLHRPPLALSGGERRLAAIGSVLCLNPSHLVLDEPFAHLDWEGIRRVRNVLAELNQTGKTVVVIEHRISGLLPLATRCLVVEKGKIVSDGPSSEAPALLQKAHLVPKYPENPKRDLRSSTESISIQALTHEREGKKILKEISFQVRQGEAVAVVGRNGSGKTTLIRHFNGLRRSREGLVSVMGWPLKGKGPLEMASLVGISFQNPNDQFFKNRVREELEAGIKISGKGQDGVREICDLFQIHDLLDRSPYRLSEGEKRRVAIASIAAMNPGILVIDEPTVGQDGRFLEALAALVASLRNRGYTVVIVTHDFEFALAVSDRWIVLHEGRIVGDGRPEELIKDETLIAMGAMEPETEGTAPKIPPAPLTVPPPFEKGDRGGFVVRPMVQDENHLLTKLDPRTKIFLGVMAIAVVLLTRSPGLHGLESLILFSVLPVRRMIKPWARGMRLMGPMIALVFIIGLISFDFQTASLLALRLFNLLTVSFVFFRTMPPEEIGDGMRKLGVPYEFSFILTTSMRYVPLIGRRIRLIMEAQMSRGIDLRPRFRNVPNFLALLMPLLIQSFLLSEELAMAMEARGFGLKGRTFRKTYRITPKDVVLILLSLILLAGFLWWERG